MSTSFAIVPAAGRSVRMGRPKLLLTWRGSTVIDHILETWHASGVDHTVVVVDRRDEALIKVCRATGADVVVAAPPPADMKASVRTGLESVRDRYRPSEGDAWLVAPADIPGLSSTVIDLLLTAYPLNASDILVPVYENRRGHPALFPWSLADEVTMLGSDDGLDQLLRRHSVREVECPVEAIAGDLDTPEDYQRRHKRCRP